MYVYVKSVDVILDQCGSSDSTKYFFDQQKEVVLRKAFTLNFRVYVYLSPTQQSGGNYLQ